MTPQTRKTIEDAIESLVALLDQLDGDPDLETADEPDLEDDGTAEPEGGI
ncbi:hypothetical protein [Breoghania sp.]|nr:hypothetical protein [Breoghania sp.]